MSQKKLNFEVREKIEKQVTKTQTRKMRRWAKTAMCDRITCKNREEAREWARRCGYKNPVIKEV